MTLRSADVRPIPTLDEIKAVAMELMELPQVEMPVTHHFAPGIYGREFFVPAGTFVIGHVHKHPHLNILLSGSMTVLCDGQKRLLKAPEEFVSGGGLAKLAHVHEDMRFLTIHPVQDAESRQNDVDNILEEICEFTDEFRNKKPCKQRVLMEEGAA